MRTPVVLILLLVLVAIPTAIFLLPDGAEAAPGETAAGAAEAQPAEDSLPQQAGAAANTDRDAAGRGRLGKDLLVQALLPSGELAGETLFLVREGESTRSYERGQGRLTLPRTGPGLEIALYAGGRWSEARRVGEEERQVAEEIALEALLPSVSVEVQVRGVDGRPAPEFTVEASWSGPPSGAELRRYLTGLLWSRNAPERLTGRDGSLSFRGLPAGTYTFRVDAEGAARQRPSVALDPGEHEVVVVELHAGAYLRGRVTLADGSPLAGAEAFVLPEMARNIREMIPAERWIDLAPEGGKGAVGEDGRFLLGPVPEGGFLVLARADGYLTSGPAEPAVMVAGQTLDVGSFALRPGRGLELRVVREEDGQPLEGARIRYLSGALDGNLLSALVPWQKAAEPTGADGRLRIEGLPPGKVTVQADCEGRAMARAEVPADQGDRDPFQLALGPSLVLAGVVLDARDSEPVAGARLRALPQAGTLFDDMFASIAPEGGHPQTLSGEDGRFRLDGLGPGHWRLGLQHEDYAALTAGPFELDPLLPETEVTIRLLQGASLLVTVLDDKDEPLPDTIVTVQNFSGQGGPLGEQTDENGQIQFEHLAGGTYQVQAIPTSVETLAGMMGGDLGGLRTIAAFVEIEDQEVRELTLGGRADSCTLQGYLTCGDEIGAGLSVMLLSMQGTRVANSDDVGFYEFDAVREGDYMLMVGKFGLGSGSGYATTVHVSGTGVMQHDIELPMTGLTVRVVGQADGKPIASVAVMVRREDGGQGGGFQLTDELGVTEFRYLAAARYVASVGRAAMPMFGSGGDLASRVLEPVELTQGGHQRLEVSLGQGAEVLARVLDSRGSPVQGASVFVLDDKGQPLTLFSMNGTGSDGRIRVGSLPGGRVRLLARHERLGQVEQEVWLQPGGTAETDLVLQPGCTLRILVVDQEGEPTSGIQAICFDQRGAPLSMMVQGVEAMQRGMAFLQGGEQVAGPLPPGKYRVVLTDLGAKTVSHEVVVEPGMSELRLDLAFPR